MLNLGDIQQVITKILTHWFDQSSAPKQSRLFKQVLYLIVGINAIYFLWDAPNFFGENSIIYRRTVTAFTWHDIVYLLYYFPHFARAALVGIALISAAGFAGKRYVVTDLLLLFLQVNFNNAVYAGLSGGHELVQQLLLYACVISMRADTLQNSYLRFLHNLAVLAVQLQLCVVYLVAALSKCADTTWLQGEAIFQVLQLQHFSLIDGAAPNENSAFLKLLNYALMAYQLLFPLLIWWQKWRKALIIVGSLIYVVIGVNMGLVFFAATMLCAHIIFWPIKRN